MYFLKRKQDGLICRAQLFVLDYSIELVESEVFPFERKVPTEMVEKIDKYLAKKELAEAAKK